MTTIKIEKQTATLLSVISRGKGMTVEKLILAALDEAFKEDVKAARSIMKSEEGKLDTDQS